MPKNQLVRGIDQKRTSTGAVIVSGGAGGGGVSDHGALTGLGDAADHPWALTATTGDARYVPLTREVNAGNGLTGGGALSGNVSLALASSVAGAGLTHTTGVLAVGAGAGITVNADDVALASTVAGAGLAFSSGVLSVNVDGLGLSVASDNVTLTSSSNPVSSASILATDSGGGIQIGKLQVGSGPAITLWGTDNPATNPDIEFTANGVLAAQGTLYNFFDSDNSGTGALCLWGVNGRTTGAMSEVMRLTETGTLTVAEAMRTPILETASGILTIQPAGDLVLTPGGGDVLPGSTDLIDLGSYNRKWRTLYASELYVETLVAQDVLSTIGGRIEVTPTTLLIADLASGDAVIDVKHNNLRNGEFAYLKAAPGGVAQLEVIKITSTATAITGGYRYSLLRNQDGTGANNWYTGDAVASLGLNSGEGFISLTATNTILSHAGPSIVTYVRTGTSWNSVKATTVQGNLESFVDYSVDEFGFAVGNDLTLAPTTGFRGLTADRTNGIRLFSTDLSFYDGSTQTGSITNDGALWFGTDSTHKKLEWDGATLTVDGSGTFSGTITATSGSIGGWSLTSSQIQSHGGRIALVAGGVGVARLDTVDSLTTPTYGAGIVVRGSATGIAIWAGKPFADITNSPFQVQMNGKLTATDAVLTGSLTAGNVSITPTDAMLIGVGATHSDAASIRFMRSAVKEGQISAYSGYMTISANGALALSSGTGIFVPTGSNLVVTDDIQASTIWATRHRGGATTSYITSYSGTDIISFTATAFTSTIDLTAPAFRVASGTGYLKVGSSNVVTWSASVFQTTADLGASSWTTLSFDDEWPATRSGTVYAKKFGDQVFLRGWAKTTGASGTYRCVDLPTGYARTSSTIIIYLPKSNADHIKAEIVGDGSGAGYIKLTSYVTTQEVYFDNASFFIS